MPRGLRHLLGSALIAATCLAESPESPRILEHPQSMSVAEGGTATFGVVAVGTPPLSYQWFTNGVLVAEATNSALPLSGLLPPADGTRVVAAVRNALAEVTSEEAVLTVIPDTERPQLLAARPGDTLRSILLTFSEPLAEGGASDPAYYTAPGLEIGAAQLLSPTRVRLLSSTQADATVYTVTVSDQVTDRAFTPNGMDPEACQLSLTSLVYVARGLKYERYEGLPADSTSLADLTNHVEIGRAHV